MGTVAVLGTGPSINLYLAEAPFVFDDAIGVNDIWKYVKSRAVVCLDKPSVFTSERLKIINECTPEVFFSQMVIWDTRPDFRKINFQSGYPDSVCDIDSPLLPKSFCSPFVACAIAYKYYHAKEIHLFGVDMRNHPRLKDVKVISGIKRHFRNLQDSLIARESRIIVHGDGILAEL